MNTQEKQIEILMQHIKKINTKLTESRKTIRLTKNENDHLKLKNLKMQKQIYKVKKAFQELSQQEKDFLNHSYENLNSIDNNNNNNNNHTQENDKEENKETKLSTNRLKSIISQLEKSLKKQRDSFLKEISSLKSFI